MDMVARELNMIARELVSFDGYSEEFVKFTSDVAKGIVRRKRDADIKSVRQNYSGTGSRKGVRQLWVRKNNGTVVDVWLTHKGFQFGGVLRTNLSTSLFHYNNRSASEIAMHIVDMIARHTGRS